VDYHIERTNRRCREDQFVERMVRPQEPALEAVTSCRLFILPSGRVRLKSGCPREASEVENSRVAFFKLRRLGHARALPGLLDFRGGGPHHAPKSIVLLWGHEGWA
jgi:hypothetical protein